MRRLLLRLLVAVALCVAATISPVDAQLRGKLLRAPGPFDAAHATAADAAWQSAWVAKVINTVVTNPPMGITKTAHKTLYVGDSMTESCAFGGWALFPTGGTVTDLATISWLYADLQGDVRNGFTWSCGQVTAGGGATWGDSWVTDLWTDTRVNDAQFALIQFNAVTDLTIVQTRIDQMLAVGIVPILSTVPPHFVTLDPTYDDTYNVPFNTALLAKAQANALPIIDFHLEVTKRQSGTSWFGTLIDSDGIHPTANVGSFTYISNPYIDGGDATTHRTGNALRNSGYNLRTWLTVQKMKQIRSLAGL